MRPSLTTLCLLAAALMMSCGDDDAVPVEEDCLTEPTLTSLEQTYFQPSCALPACHSTADHAGGLNLTVGAVASETIGVFGQNGGAIARGKQLVVPGDPGASFLLQKVLEPDSGEGGLMPPGVDEPVGLECGVAALELWIANGAKTTP